MTAQVIFFNVFPEKTRNLMPLRITTKEAKAEFEQHPIIAKAKIGKCYLLIKSYWYISSIRNFFFHLYFLV